MASAKDLIRYSVTRLSTIRLHRAFGSAPTPIAEKLFQAVLEAMEADFTAPERAWITRIERLRAELEASVEQITFTDYGVDRAGICTEAPVDSRGRYATGLISAISRRRSARRFRHMILFKLIRHLAPQRCVELGTCFGLSANYQAAALKLNGGGNIITVDGAEPFVKIATANLRSLELDHVRIFLGLFRHALPVILEEDRRIDFAFLDGDHEEEATIEYFRWILQSSAPVLVVVIDDIRWSQGMRRAWQRIRVEARIAVTIDLYGFGICAIYDHDHRPIRLFLPVFIHSRPSALFP
jgi:predicted O-methyltransferase YrrM